MSDFYNNQQAMVEGLRNNASKVSPEFKKIRFYLDNVANKDEIDRTARNKFLSGFKSFWICDTNNTSFVASMFVNTRGDVGQSLPLKPNMSLSFQYPVDGCALEWSAQAGVWIDIVFALNTDITPGYIQLSAGGSTAINEGSSHPSTWLKSIDATGASVICPANSNRKVSMIQNNSGAPIWIGTQADLAGGNYKTDCIRIDSGDAIFYWRNTAQLNARSEAGTLRISAPELT